MNVKSLIKGAKGLCMEALERCIIPGYPWPFPR